MGFTSVWLNPILENDVPVASYHGYSTTDYYSVDPRFGSNEQYRELVAEMKERGVGMVMDLIVNHIGGGHWWMDDLPTHDWLNFQDEPILTHRIGVRRIWTLTPPSTTRKNMPAAGFPCPCPI